MKRIGQLLTTVCFLALLGINFSCVHATVKSKVADMESTYCDETELAQVTFQLDNGTSLLDEQGLITWAATAIQASRNNQFAMDQSARLPWQHRDDLLMPPEYSSARKKLSRLLL